MEEGKKPGAATPVQNDKEIDDINKTSIPQSGELAQSMGDRIRPLCEYGWMLIPIPLGEKRPCHPKWQTQRYTWAELEPYCQEGTWGFGVLTGEPSRLAVVDIDVQHDGHLSLEALAAEHGSLPVTPRVQTPSGGSHYYFRHTPELAKTANNNTGVIGPGIDFRTTGGQCVIPPMLRFNEERAVFGVYRWDVPPECLEGGVPVADPPQWLVQKLLKGSGKKRTGVRRLRNEDLVNPWPELGKKIPKGQRDDWLFRRLCGFVTRGYREKALRMIAYDLNDKYLEPPLYDDEVESKVNNAFKYITEEDMQ